jgi:hypothetical protein
MGFDLYKRALKIRDSNSQSGSSLGNVDVHSFPFSYIPENMKCDSWAHSWLALLQALILVASPKLRLQQWRAMVNQLS